jgi:hypothetical protein
MKITTQLTIQLLIVCISCLLFSCTTKQTETVAKQDSIDYANKSDSVYQGSQAVINRYDTIRNYLPIDKDTLVSEREILLDNEVHKLKIVKYCLNDSALISPVLDYGSRSRVIYIGHTYSIQIALHNGKKTIVNERILTKDFEDYQRWIYFSESLYDIQFESAKENRLLFVTTHISPDTSSVSEGWFRVFYKTEKIGQLDFSPVQQDWVIHNDRRLYRLISSEYTDDSPDDAGFISLSDSYLLSEHSDSLAIPNLYNNVSDENPITAVKDGYINLKSRHRKRFLTKTGISETDKLFLYNYYHNTLDSIAVKNLNVVALISTYISPKDRPYSQRDYMIGFEVEKRLMKKLGMYYDKTFAYIGNQNPFIQGQLKPIVWEKIERADFPAVAMSTKNSLLWQKWKREKAYKYEANNLGYYVQEFLNIRGRRVLVIDLQTKETMLDLFYFSSESSSPAPLNFTYEGLTPEQWTGRLFKGKPTVLFGFEYISFGCPSIIFLDKSESGVGFIEIYCDNRH